MSSQTRPDYVAAHDASTLLGHFVHPPRLNTFPLRQLAPQEPTMTPSRSPTTVPTLFPTEAPTQLPTRAPTTTPTTRPTQGPTTVRCTVARSQPRPSTAPLVLCLSPAFCPPAAPRPLSTGRHPPAPALAPPDPVPDARVPGAGGAQPLRHRQRQHHHGRPLPQRQVAPGHLAYRPYYKAGSS
jgi:hypothetical protein